MKDSTYGLLVFCSSIALHLCLLLCLSQGQLSARGSDYANNQQPQLQWLSRREALHGSQKSGSRHAQSTDDIRSSTAGNDVVMSVREVEPLLRES